MGAMPAFKGCMTNPSSPAAAAPNPDPSRFEVVNVKQYRHAYVLTVRYLDCTNFEGVKVMVFRGMWDPTRAGRPMDPHFTPEATSPIARFRPDAEGASMAIMLASSLGPRSAT